MFMLKLVALIALFQVYTIQVYASDGDEEYNPFSEHHFRKHIQIWTVKNRNSEEEDSINRQFQLVNVCSKKLVQILGHNEERRNPVNAQGSDYDSIFTKLLFKTISFGEIRIQSPRSGWYLCFSKKGKLIIRRNGNNERCTFKEIRDEEKTVTKLQSVANEKWFVGFRKNGRPLKGFDVRNTRREKCFNFYKRELTADGKPRTSSSREDTNDGPFKGPNLSSWFSQFLLKQKARDGAPVRSRSRRRMENT